MWALPHTRRLHPHLTFLRAQDYEVARRMEKEADSDNMVFLSDVHLDSASVC